jgi:hypothetical protein
VIIQSIPNDYHGQHIRNFQTLPNTSKLTASHSNTLGHMLTPTTKTRHRGGGDGWGWRAGYPPHPFPSPLCTAPKGQVAAEQNLRDLLRNIYGCMCCLWISAPPREKQMASRGKLYRMEQFLIMPIDRCGCMSRCVLYGVWALCCSGGSISSRPCARNNSNSNQQQKQSYNNNNLNELIENNNHINNTTVANTTTTTAAL